MRNPRLPGRRHLQGARPGVRACCGRALTAAAAVIGLAGGPTGVAALDARLAYAGDTLTSAYHGAQQGLGEARLQGEFLGQTYELVPLDERGAAPGERVAAIVAAVPKDALLQLARRHPQVAVLNVVVSDDALRDPCVPNLLHVIPSDTMIAQATHAGPKAAQARAQAWHPDFEKYAAAQLNHRYRDRFDEPMDDTAWAGWAAVKLVSDTIARAQTDEPTAVLADLREKLAFDGQKGVEMRFDDRGQLRQPLLLVADGKVVAETGVLGTPPAGDGMPSACAR